MSRLPKTGIDRDWKQCRTKHKSLKYEHKTVRTAHGLGMTRNMKFFTEVSAVLGNSRKITKA